MKRTLWCLGLIVVLFVLSLSGAFAETRYTVKPGDTLCKIAKKFSLKPQDLREANGLKGSALTRNQTLVIPVKGATAKSVSKEGKRQTAGLQGKKGFEETELYRVKKGDTLKSIAAEVNCSESQLRKMNHLKSKRLRVGRNLLVPKLKESEEQLADLNGGEEADDTPAAVAEEEVRQERQKTSATCSVGRWNGNDERCLFIRVVKTFLGVPYRYGGSTLRGIDCSAFTRRVYEIVDVQLPRTAREQSMQGKWVKQDELQEGDLVFFRTRRVNDHVGIYIGNNQFVHLSSRNKEAKIDNLGEPYFQKRFIRGVRVKELIEEKDASPRAALANPQP